MYLKTLFLYTYKISNDLARYQKDYERENSIL